MQAPIAQAVALTLAGNRFLRGGDVGAFWPEASVFRYCKRVAFVTLSGPDPAPVAEPYADHPLAWLKKIQAEGVSALRLLYVPSHGTQRDRETVGLAGGGGRRFVATASGERADLWEARWAVSDRKDPAQKIWAVTYGRVATGFDLTEETPREAPAVRAELAATLAEIAKFADAQQLDNFAESFRTAMERLASPTPLAGGWFETLDDKDGLGLPARQLLGAAEAAWVFGAMGSWNDLGFQGEIGETYDDLSNRLFALLNEVTVVAANASLKA
ncbi:hypothetical protein FRZ44_21240 [Hypericibacter terrae]|uniref:Uncharacterized protein n=1 Tax=Hypericibacter terrae TaxID=2602015 RepID=A0A5J6MH99_9PROT|nr:hypothetical protein [Hypericibacter terrae]QEX16829.1 hypothetical protein FRZ44_21240 [Hypericibacter terrae]